jgi:hypothetical protein
VSARRIVFALVAVAAAVLIAHSLVWNFVTDDAFISFVYSRNLARHGQLVFNLGERVEGYTNFLWTVLLAGLLKLGLAPELTSRVLGTAAAVGTLVTTAFASRRVRALGARWEWSPWDALPALLLAGVPGFACWASGGLETALFTFLVTLGVTAYFGEHERDRPSWRSAVAFGLAALTRPEGILFFALTLLHRGIILLSRRRFLPRAAELRWVAWFCALVVPHLLWRRWYYGWWLPNTFYIKSSGGAGTWAQGAFYLRLMIVELHLWVVPLLAIAGLVARRERGMLTLVGYASLVVGSFYLYVLSVGGDFMGLYRFAMPVVPLLALTAAAGVRLVASRLRLAAPAAAALALALLAGHAAHAYTVDKRSLRTDADAGPAGNIDHPGYLRWYTADRAAVGKWFGQYARPDDYAAVGGAGAQVYYSGIASLDCFGLSDEYIAHKVAPMSARPGHQKYAPLDYQLARKPTIVTSNYYKLERYTPPPAEAAMWSARGYHYVSVEVPGLSSRWYSFLLRNDRSLGPLERVDQREP